MVKELKRKKDKIRKVRIDDQEIEVSSTDYEYAEERKKWLGLTKKKKIKKTKE